MNFSFRDIFSKFTLHITRKKETLEIQTKQERTKRELEADLLKHHPRTGKAVHCKKTMEQDQATR